MDLISELPEPILHQILDFLPVEDAARTSILSKRWRSIRLSCPIVDLRYEEYFKKTNTNFKKFVENTLQNCVAKNMGLLTFRLRITSYGYESDKWKDVVDQWFNFLARRSRRIGLQEVDIELGCTRRVSYYFPASIVLASEALIRLSLSGLLFDPLEHNKCNINLPLLQRLLVCNMDVDDTFVRNFISSCPLLEDLEIRDCKELTSFKVSSLHFQRIKNIRIVSCRKIRKVEIRAISLHYFWFFGGKITPCEIDLAGCDNLNTLRLDLYATIDMASSLAWVQNQISELVGLEYLILYCPSLETIKISNPKLKRLKIQACKNLSATTEIDAPNLHSVEYIQNKLPFYSLNTKKFKKATFEFDLGDHFQNPAVWLCKLKELYEKTMHIQDFKVAIQSKLSLIAYDELSESVLLIILEQLKDVKPYTNVIISSMSSEDWLPFLFSKGYWTNLYVASSSHMFSSHILREFCKKAVDKKHWGTFYMLDDVEIESIKWIEEKDRIPLLKPHQNALYNLTYVHFKWIQWNHEMTLNP